MFPVSRTGDLESGSVETLPVFYFDEILSQRDIVDSDVTRAFRNHDFGNCTFTMPWKKTRNTAILSDVLRILRNVSLGEV